MMYVAKKRGDSRTQKSDAQSIAVSNDPTAFARACPRSAPNSQSIITTETTMMIAKRMAPQHGC